MTSTITRTKTVALRLKAVGPDNGVGDMQFEGYASVFGNVDSYGDVVRKGAFADTLTEWESSDEVLPVYWGHNMMDPDANIGHIVEAHEDDKGLFVRGQLDPESPKAQTVYRLLKGRRVGDMSYSYAVTDGEFIDSASKADGEDGSDPGGEYYEIRSLKLYEVSIVPVGANPLAEITGVKAGRVLSSKNLDAIKAAIEALQGVVKDAESSSDSGKASTAGASKGEAREGKPEDSTRDVSATQIDASPTATPEPVLTSNAVLSALALLDIERTAR